MPYVDLHCSNDYASIFYTTNTPRGNVSAFQPDKPSIIILHPLFLDSTWLQHQFGDPRITSNYNVIAFDMRVCGKSSARPTPRHDSWVDAADLALCHRVRRTHRGQTSLSNGIQGAAFTPLPYSSVGGHLHQLRAPVRGFVRSFSLTTNTIRSSCHRFPEMCLSLTLCNVPAPSE